MNYDDRGHETFFAFALTFTSYLSGLMLHNVLEGLQKFPEGRCYLVMSDYPEMGDAKAFFKPVFSTDERQKEKEEVIVYNFHQFLNKLESKLSTEKICEIMSRLISGFVYLAAIFSCTDR